MTTGPDRTNPFTDPEHEASLSSANTSENHQDMEELSLIVGRDASLTIGPDSLVLFGAVLSQLRLCNDAS